jgi:hypothetical protein
MIVLRKRLRTLVNLENRQCMKGKHAVIAGLIAWTAVIATTGAVVGTVFDTVVVAAMAVGSAPDGYASGEAIHDNGDQSSGTDRDGADHSNW